MRPSARLSAIVLGLGVAFDLAGNGQQPGASVPLLIAAVAVALRATSPRSGERDLLLLGAVLAAAFVAFRADETLLTLNAIALLGLLALAATGTGTMRLTVAAVLTRSLSVARGLLLAPGFVLRPLRIRVPGARRLRDTARPLIIAVPLVVVFAALLGSADRVFADAVLPDLPAMRLSWIAGHAFLIVLGALLAGSLWAAPATATPAATAPVTDAQHRARMAPADWTIGLGGIATVFSAFVVVQLAFLFGGRGRVEVTPGLTYAEYARSGFFQLLAVGALTVIVVLGAWDLGRRESPKHERRFQVLVGIMVALCLVVLASAAFRLALYQQAFGFTTSRLAAWFAIGVTGAALIGLAVAIVARRRDTVVSGALALGLAALLAANILSPGSFVAERNAERFAATGRIDVFYLTTLGPEAVPTLVRLLPRLPHADATPLREALCAYRSELPNDPGWRSWNLSRVRARAALRTLRC